MFIVKPSEETTTKTFRIPIVLLNRLEIFAQKKGVSMNKLVA